MTRGGSRGGGEEGMREMDFDCEVLKSAKNDFR